MTEKKVVKSYGILAYTQDSDLKFLLGKRVHTYAFSDIVNKRLRKETIKELAAKLTYDEQTLIFSDRRYKNIANIITGISPKGSPIWSPMRGRPRDEESDIECAIREFREETKMDAEDMEFSDIAISEEIETEDAVFVCTYFLAKSFGEFLPYYKKRLGREVRQLKWFTFEGALKILENRETTQDIIREAKSIIEE